ncbi:ribbon-helix-helix domain-containing protein [Mesorhizobium sp. ORM8.1]
MSDSTISPPVARERLLPPLATEDFGLEFRVVARGGVRRGIRLERAFWTALKQMAENRKCTIGSLIDEIAESHAHTGNLTSAIRVACMRGLADENSTLQKLASIKTINAILLACPSPAFALASSKKILTFNAPFQQLVRRQLPVTSNDDTRPISSWRWISMSPISSRGSMPMAKHLWRPVSSSARATAATGVS